MFKNMTEVKKANKDAGHHFFDKSTMQFFDSRIESRLIGGRVFVTSEQYEDEPRHYAVRSVNDDGTIDTAEVDIPAQFAAGPMGDKFKTFADARQYADDLAHGYEYVIEGDYGSGYEIVTHEECKPMARENLRRYKENELSAMFRVRRIKSN